jgi:phosphinothricin acetyltransferase
VELSVRPGEARDLTDLVRIYNWYVVHSSATFDTEPVTVDDRREWFARFGTAGPHRLLVALGRHGTVVGYAGSMRYRDHPAFDGTVELTVYVDAAERTRGIGSSLYATLLDELAHEPIHRLVVGIALPNDGPTALHQPFGVEAIGVFDEYARKGDRWVSSLWMQRAMDRAAPC